MRRLAIQVRAVIVASDSYRRALATAVGVSVTEVTALEELRLDGPLTPSELTRRLGLTSPSVTSLLDRLEVAGLVVRQRHPADRRSVLVRLTDPGHNLLSAAFELFTDDIAAAVATAAPGHVEELSRLLGGIADGLLSRASDRSGIARDLAERLALGPRTQPPDGSDE